MASHLKARALFLVLLIAGHEAVRVRDTIQLHSAASPPRDASEDDWQRENKACSWSTLTRNPGCKGPGCAYRYLPWDAPVPASSESCRLTDEYMLTKDRTHYFQLQAKLLAAKSSKFSEKCKSASSMNLKCQRRAKHVYRAMKFLTKAQDSSLIESLSVDQKKADRELFEESLGHMSKMAGPDGALVLELTEKMKARSADVKEDPLGTVQNVVNLLTKLLKGSEEEKEAARKEISEMEASSDAEETDNAMEGEELRDYVTKLEKGAADIRENLDSAAEDLDFEPPVSSTLTTALTELGSNANSTALIQRNALLGETDVAVVKGIAFAVIVVLVVCAIIWAVLEIVAIIVAWALISVIGCGAYALGRNAAIKEGNSNVQKMGAVDALKCIGTVFTLPFVYVYRGGKYIYRLIAGKKKTDQRSTGQRQ